MEINGPLANTDSNQIIIPFISLLYIVYRLTLRERDQSHHEDNFDNRVRNDTVERERERESSTNSRKTREQTFLLQSQTTSRQLQREGTHDILNLETRLIPDFPGRSTDCVQ